MSAEPIRVLLVDDHAGFRAGLAALISTIDGLEPVGEASNGLEAVDRAAELQPDVVLMDLAMPELDGIAATRRIVDTSPHIAVLVLTMVEDDSSVFDALRAGARGYLLKGADRAELLRAVRAVARGEAIFGPGVARRLIAFFAAPRPAHVARVFPELTDREREILKLVAESHSTKEIAEKLGISVKTVDNHRTNLMRKLNMHDVASLTRYALDIGLIDHRAPTW